ncbi:MAG: nucleotidyl transferase AbiEii/AbiGii toxin family protein [Elusimicrobiota bacterium]
MILAVEKMLSKYKLDSVASYENALKEIIQEIALLGLWRAKFFEHAAFYGGTALRIFYGMDRFSEDLDFSLLKPNKSFNLFIYNKAVQEELSSMGFNVQVNEKKRNNESNIQAAFIKADTKMYDFEVNLDPRKKLKIKFEIDINPPQKFETETKYLLNPTEFYVKVYSKPDLFAGKLHAVLCRRWGKRVKGRDWFDFIWFVKNKVPVNLRHLEARLKQTEHLEKNAVFNADVLREMLLKRIEELDIELAKKDVLLFLSDTERLQTWSKEFFSHIVSQLMVL